MSDAPQTKRCPICGESKPVSAFYMQNHDGRSYAMGACKVCHVARVQRRKKERMISHGRA